MIAEDRRKNVFIAYSTTDAAAAEQVARTLEHLGVETFRFEQASGAGRSVENTLWQALHDADAFVAVIGTEPVNPNVMFELGVAVGAGKPIFFLAVDQAQVRLPFDLGRYHVLPVSRASDLPYLLGEVSEARTPA